MPPIGWRKNSGFKTPGEAASSGMGNIISYFKPKPKPKPGRPSNESKAGRKSATPPENLWTGLKPPTAAEKAAAAKANSTARNLASAANKAKSGEVLDAVETAAVIQAAAAATKAPGVKRHRTNWSLKENTERLSKAVNGWPAYKAANPTFSIEGYAKSLNINRAPLLCHRLEHDSQGGRNRERASGAHRCEARRVACRCSRSRAANERSGTVDPRWVSDYGESAISMPLCVLDLNCS